MIFPKRERRRALAVTFVTSKWIARAPAGTIVMRVFFGGYAHPEVKQTDDATIVRWAREELEALGLVAGSPTAAHVFRYDDGSPQPVVGHRERIARLRAALAPHRGLAIAGAPIDGVGIPDCVRQAGEAVASLRLGDG